MKLVERRDELPLRKVPEPPKMTIVAGAFGAPLIAPARGPPSRSTAVESISR